MYSLSHTKTLNMKTKKKKN